MAIRTPVLPTRVSGQQEHGARPRVWNKHHKNAPADAVYIGRGSPWGNPFKIGVHGTRAEVIQMFEENLTARDRELIKYRLKDKHLVCFCAPHACHGDVLLRIANSD
jgi:hypothetical protein